MPNYAYSDLTIRGDPADIDKIVDIKFDFNKIIQQPQGLIDDCEEYCAKCKSREFIDSSPSGSGTCKKCNIGSNIGGRTSSHAKTDKERYSQLNKDEIKLAKKWKKEYGTESWYDWNTANWGTKWNAGDVEITRDGKDGMKVTFQTAWGPPLPIFEKLAEDYNIQIQGTFEIEGDGDTYNESWGNYK